MRSDERVQKALSALSGPISTYRTAVATAIQRIRGYLASEPSGKNGKGARTRAELGSFAAGRIDPERFASLFAGAPTLDLTTRRRVERALKVLQRFASAGDEIFCTEVASGGRLRFHVAEAYGELGAAFGAAVAVEFARAGRYEQPLHDALLQAFPFAAWNRAERRIAPPLVVRVEGADLRVGVLNEFLDGTVKIVLILQSTCTPAPLVRLITPGTFVMQTAELAQLERLANVPGPAIAALVPKDAAQFVHDPAGGASIRDRLTIASTPEWPKKPLGCWSAWQQAEELRQLQSLIAQPAEPAKESAVAPISDDPAERLAAWLLQQSKLTPRR